MEPITEDTTTRVIENASKKMALKEALEETHQPGILVAVPKPKPKGYPVDPDGLKAVHRLRVKFEKHGPALDALLYYLLAQQYKDLPAAIKRGHAYCESDAGAHFYGEVCRVLKKVGDDDSDSCSSSSSSDCDSDSDSDSTCSSSSSDSCTETDDSSSACTEEIYDYSTEWAKAAKHRDGLLTMRQSFLSPEYSTLQALSRFSKRCW